MNKASHYDAKAKAAERNTTIYDDDPEALPKLCEKLAALEADHAAMKTINAYYRKHKTLTGCPDLADHIAERINASMARSCHKNPVPYEAWALSNNNANIKRIRDRIAKLEERARSGFGFEGWAFEGGEVIVNEAENRLQIVFNGKPAEDVRAKLKANGFCWAPSQKAWQRQLTRNALFAARHIEVLRIIQTPPCTFEA